VAAESRKKGIWRFSLNYRSPTRLILICCIKYSKVLDLAWNQNRTLKLGKHPGTDCRASSELECTRSESQGAAEMQGDIQSRIPAPWVHPNRGGWCVRSNDSCLRLLGDVLQWGQGKEGREEGGGMWMEQQTTKTALWSLGVRKQHLTVKGWKWGKLSSWTIYKLNCRTPNKHA